MYKLHLIRKYLFKRKIAWVSLVAVMLCTAMVLVVISVMGGWLRMFRESFHGLSGDIIVQADSMNGFAHYQEMIRRIEALPEVEAAAPVIRTFGLITINNNAPRGVQVIGYPPEIGKINAFTESLHRQYQAPLKEGKPPATRPSFALLPEFDYEERVGRRMRNPREMPGIIVGAALVGIGKNEKGEVDRPDDDLLYGSSIRLEVLAMNEDTVSLESSRPTANRYWIVDDSRTQIWQYDSDTVYVPFDVLQKDLNMHARTETDADTDEPIEVKARTTDVHVRIKDGLDLYAVKPKVIEIVEEFYPVGGMLYPPVSVQTWEESQATYLGAVEKEKALVTFLFGMISIVAIFLIFCIFYMIVVEKTKDIGIIKSVGATNTGVAGIFLGYGLAIGIVGAAMGLLVAYGIVHNINEIHTWISEVTGTAIWDPKVYAFDTIPNTMNSNEVTVIMIVAVISAVLGALVPAYRAARLHPVESLRWE